MGLSGQNDMLINGYGIPMDWLTQRFELSRGGSATHMRLSATVIALVSVLSGSVSSAYLAAQVAEPPTAKVLYEAGGFEHWSFPLTPDWTRLQGMLLNNGTHRGSVSAPIFAPYRPELAHYAVEADIRV